jgi:hypothetical protein
LEGDVATEAYTAVIAMEGRARADFDGEASIDRAAIEFPSEVGAAEAEDGSGAEENSGRLESDFEAGLGFGISGEEVRNAKAYRRGGAGFA